MPNPVVGQLYVVALPIGNVEDLSPRARQILTEVEVVAAEDTREFQDLCRPLKLHVKRVVAYHDHNEEESARGLLALLEEGKNIAVVSDAGTPGVSDPGYRLVKRAYDQGIRVHTIPGPSSLTAALAISPVGGTSHYFGGFTPSAETDRTLEFERVLGLADRLIYFEAPHRLIASLETARKVFGRCDVACLRELTKPHQEVIAGTLDEVLAHFKVHEPRGEFVVIFGATQNPGVSLEETRAAVLAMIEGGTSNRDIRETLQKKSALPRKELYQLIEHLRRQKDET